MKRRWARARRAMAPCVVLLAAGVSHFGVSGSFATVSADRTASAGEALFPFTPAQITALPTVDPTVVDTAPVEGVSVSTSAAESGASVTSPAVTSEESTLVGRTIPASERATVADVPSPALAAYQRAAAVLNIADEKCDLEWQLIAAIGRVESNHGRFGGNVLDADGVAQPGIYGLPLTGRNGTSRIDDTDAGLLDGDKKFDRAVGPMQFIPSTWAVVGVDADADGERNPQDIDDAALATAVYLCSGKGSLGVDSGMRKAIYSYNHSRSYVDLVISIYDSYSAGDYAGLTSTSAASFNPGSSTQISTTHPGPGAGDVADAVKDAQHSFNTGHTKLIDAAPAGDQDDVISAAPGDSHVGAGDPTGHQPQPPTSSPTPSPSPSPAPSPAPSPTPSPSPSPAPSPTPSPSPTPDEPAEPAEPAPSTQPNPSPGPSPTAPSEPTPDPKPDAKPDPKPEPKPEPSPEPSTPPKSAPSPEPAPPVSPAQARCNELGYSDGSLDQCATILKSAGWSGAPLGTAAATTWCRDNGYGEAASGLCVVVLTSD